MSGTRQVPKDWRGRAFGRTEGWYQPHWWLRIKSRFGR